MTRKKERKKEILINEPLTAVHYKLNDFKRINFSTQNKNSETVYLTVKKRRRRK